MGSYIITQTKTETQLFSDEVKHATGAPPENISYIYQRNARTDKMVDREN